MCREQNISIPRPSTDGGSHDEAEINEPDIADVIRANLLWLRQARGLSLQDLAVVAGVNPAELDELAAGRSFPAWACSGSSPAHSTWLAIIEEPATVRRGRPRRLAGCLKDLVSLAWRNPPCLSGKGPGAGDSPFLLPATRPGTVILGLACPLQEGRAVDLERRGESPDQANGG